MITGPVATAISIRQAIFQSELSNYARAWFIAPSVLLTCSIVVMVAGLLAWGWFVQQYASADFHGHNGGLFSSTNFLSWTASCTVLLAAAVIAIKSARPALSQRAP